MTQASGVREIRAIPAPLGRRAASMLVDLAIVGAMVGLYLAVALAVTGLRVPKTNLDGLDALGGLPAVSIGAGDAGTPPPAYSPGSGLLDDRA